MLSTPFKLVNKVVYIKLESWEEEDFLQTKVSCMWTHPRWSGFELARVKPVKL